MKNNMVGLPFLDQLVLEAVFNATGDPGARIPAIRDEGLRDFTALLLEMARYNARRRGQQLNRLAPLMEDILVAMAPDTEQTGLILGVALAIKELYGMRPDTLKAVLGKWSPAE